MPIDPEDGLVDFENVEVGELSAEIDSADLASLIAPDYGAEDKVLVSIRSVYISNFFAFGQIDEVYTPVSSGFARRRPLLSGTIGAVISN